MRATMMLHLLGPPHLDDEGRRLEIAPSKPAALALYLAVHGDWIDRERLVAVFAPDTDEAAARHHLRVLLNRLRRLPWTAALEAEPSRLRFAPACDVQAFREAVGRGDHQTAVELYRRPFLDGFRVAAPAFEAWCEAERDAYARAWRDAAVRWARRLARDDPAAAARLLRRVLDDDDLAEDVLQAYLECAYLAGNRDEAVLAFERFRLRLREDLGLEPLASTLELIATIRRAERLEVTPGREQPPPVPLEVRRPPRLAGRTREVASLAAASSRVTLIAGEPGVGKTRLLEDAVPEGLWLRCREGLEGVPYQPVIDCLRADLAALPELGPYGEDLARLIPEALPGLTPGPTEPTSAKSRLLEALARSLEARSRPLIVDDLQWADPATLELLVVLARRGTARVVGAYRVDEVGAGLERILAALAASGHLEILHLEPLSPAEVRDLLADLIGVPEGPETFAAWLARHSGGNPFFALETLKMLFENGVLEAREGAWHSPVDEITIDYRELAVPTRVARLVERRLRRLSEPARRIVQTASVMREDFAPELLARVVGLSEFAVLDALEELEGTGFVVDVRFQHDLTRQSVYGGMAERRRQLLHRAVAEGLEGQAEPLLVAEHWFQAGEPRRAYPHLRAAAATLQRRGLLAEAVPVLERALDCAPGRGEELEVSAELARVQFDLARFDRAETLSRVVVGEDAAAEIRVRGLLLRSRLQLHAGSITEARRTWERAHAIGASGVDELSLCMLGAEIAQLEGRPEQAQALLAPVVEQRRHDPPARELAALLTSLGVAHDELGAYHRALPLHREALDMTQRLGDKPGQVQATMNLVWNLTALERFEEATEIGEAALSLGEYSDTSTLRNNVVYAYLALERLPEARQHLEMLAHDCPDPSIRCISWSRLATVYHRLGLAAQQHEALERGLELLSATEFRAAHISLATTVLTLGSDDQVERLTPYLRDEPFPDPVIQRNYEEARERRFAARHSRPTGTG